MMAISNHHEGKVAEHGRAYPSLLTKKIYNRSVNIGYIYIFIIILWSDEPAKICLFLVGVPRLGSSAFCLNLISGKSHRTTLGRKQTQLQTGWWHVTKGWELKAAASKSSENSRAILPVGNKALQQGRYWLSSIHQPLKRRSNTL